MAWPVRAVVREVARSYLRASLRHDRALRGTTVRNCNDLQTIPMRTEELALLLESAVRKGRTMQCDPVARSRRCSGPDGVAQWCVGRALVAGVPV